MTLQKYRICMLLSLGVRIRAAELELPGGMPYKTLFSFIGYRPQLSRATMERRSVGLLRLDRLETIQTKSN